MSTAQVLRDARALDDLRNAFLQALSSVTVEPPQSRVELVEVLCGIADRYAQQEPKP